MPVHKHVHAFVVCGNQGTYSRKDHPISSTANHAVSSHKLSLGSIIAHVIAKLLRNYFGHRV